MTDNQQTITQSSPQDSAIAVPVVLRVWRDGGEVLAIFPTLPSDEFGLCCDAYEHIGQHGGADYWLCIQASRPATAEEGLPLIQELERIGYRMRVIHRATRAMHETRMAEARRLWGAIEAPRAE